MAPSKEIQVAANRVAKAWREWDENPGSEWTVKKLCDELDVLCPLLGMGTTEFRVAVTERARAGASMIDAIRAVVLGEE